MWVENVLLIALLFVALFFFNLVFFGAGKSAASQSEKKPTNKSTKKPSKNPQKPTKGQTTTAKKTKTVPFGEQGVGKPRGNAGEGGFSAGETIDSNVNLFGDDDVTEPVYRALQFGLLYRNTAYELGGCINDLINVKKKFLAPSGFEDKNVVALTDDTKIKPTKKNMELAMLQFVRNLRNGDSLFLQYSGHGTGVEDKSGDEKDGQDEALCPLDGGVIVDDWIYANVVKPLEKFKKTKLTVLVDACHSGTCLDLPFHYVVKRGVSNRVVLAEGKRKKAQRRVASAQVVGFSAALDNECAIDTQADNMPQGAFTACFLEIIKQHLQEPMSYRDFLLAVDQLLLKRGFDHQASMSSPSPLDLDAPLKFFN